MVGYGRFTSILFLAAGLGVIRSPAAAQQEGVRLVRLDDGMSEAVYAYARAEGGVLQQIDAEGIVFADRDPALVWGCITGDIVVIYRYDTGLIGEDNTVSIRTRFDTQPASATQFWPKLGTTTGAEELGLALLTGADSLEAEEDTFFGAMMDAMAIAAMMPAELVEGFLASAARAERVTIRVTDQLDGETHTDVFALSGLATALEGVRDACRP
ncbi:MAG: hypothetical protein JSW71_13115 [Gemmatimonadota bacterium]|nr:MAG: hypothetical protein JSW71_13115 [Gemmatimonadota bacterium]